MSDFVGSKDELAAVRELLRCEESGEASMEEMAEAQEQVLSSMQGYKEGGGGGGGLEKGKKKKGGKWAKLAKRVRSKKASKEEEEPLSDRDARNMFGSSEEQDILLALTSCLSDGELDASISKDLEFWALACLRCRRYRIGRALDLLRSYSNLRGELRQEPELAAQVESLLSRGVLTFLEDKTDVKGRGILMVSLAKHDPKAFSARTFLHGLHCLVEHALRSQPRYQVTGFVLINNMSGAAMSNFDTRIPRELSSTISSRLPFRYINLFIVNPPLFFAAIFRVVSVFLNAKMRARMQQLYVSKNENPLMAHVPEKHLPRTLGGDHKVDFQEVAKTAAPYATSI